MQDFSILNRMSDIKHLTELKELFLSFNKTFDVKSYLETILQDENLLIYVSSKSYSHENGFDKITLFENLYSKLRLHLWMKDGIKYSENVHNHRWDFCSKIITGAYQFENFEITNDVGIEHYEYEYLPKTNSDKYDMVFRGKKKLLIKETGIKKKDDIHILSENELHKISSTENVTATIFLTGKLKKKSTNVFSEFIIDNSSLPYRYINSKELKEKIGLFLNVLQK